MKIKKNLLWQISSVLTLHLFGLLKSLISLQVPKDSPDFPSDSHSLSPMWNSWSKIIEPSILMRGRLIGWNRAVAGFDLCPKPWEGKYGHRNGHCGTATQFTRIQGYYWTHTCRATPEPDGTIVVTNVEDQRERTRRGRENLTLCADWPVVREVMSIDR